MQHNTITIPFETQANFVTPKVGGQAVSSEYESLDDVERNADLYFFFNYEVLHNY